MCAAFTENADLLNEKCTTHHNARPYAFTLKKDSSTPSEERSDKPTVIRTAGGAARPARRVESPGLLRVDKSLTTGGRGTTRMRNNAQSALPKAQRKKAQTNSILFIACFFIR